MTWLIIFLVIATAIYFIKNHSLASYIAKTSGVLYDIGVASVGWPKDLRIRFRTMAIEKKGTLNPHEFAIFFLATEGDVVPDVFIMKDIKTTLPSYMEVWRIEKKINVDKLGLHLYSDPKF